MSSAEVPGPNPEPLRLEVVQVGTQTPEQVERLSYEELQAGFRALTEKVVELEDELIDTRNENESLKQQVNFDALTGLLSDEGLESELKARSTDPEGVVLVDVTNFKGPNDKYGKAAGDAILKDVGNILRRSVREGDLIARLNRAGDEFVIVAFGGNDPESTTPTPVADPERRSDKSKRAAEVRDIIRTRVEEYLEGAPELKAYNFDIAAGDADWISTDTDPLHSSIERADAVLGQHKAEQHRQGHYDRVTSAMQ